MTAADRESFALLMLALAETYNQPLSDSRMELYFSALDDLSLAEVREAARCHVREQKFFPQPAELRAAIEGSLDDAAEWAWLDLLGVIRRVGYMGTPAFVDEAQRRAALDLYGGWRALCSQLPGEGPELFAQAKQFKAIYRVYARHAARGALPSPLRLSLADESEER